MGSCSSVDKDTSSTMTYRLGVNYKGRRFFAPSPAKEKPSNGENLVGKNGYDSPEFAIHNNEVFFDSRAWLDSDCEDDFFSVKGDFTPSRGSTPIHQFSAPLTPKLENSFFVDKYPESKSSEPSPTGRKKLAELFRETLQVEEVIDVPDAAVETNKTSDLHKTNTNHQHAGSLNGTPNRPGLLSFCSSAKVTPSRDPSIRKDKVWKTQQCCLPSLHSFGSDDKRHKMNPRPCTA
ncbi:hypothetical protein Cni_G24927 [Canna indica]|uniref:Uncharacterized protein n=1 Tax=Canna indica TaxID=4628 RepID=A0AAQ3KX35_9LILI|nr:hypothetical protein Cni_G24927 [Canna indica]